MYQGQLHMSQLAITNSFLAQRIIGCSGLDIMFHHIKERLLTCSIDPMFHITQSTGVQGGHIKWKRQINNIKLEKSTEVRPNVSDMESERIIQCKRISGAGRERF